MLFDLTGTIHIQEGSMKTKKIDLTGFGVMGEAGESLFPEQNPHDVSEQFAASLIHTGRAVEHDPKNPIKPVAKVEPKAPKGVQNGDPKNAQNGDPK